jgi:4-hydroxybenzoate polyprenyltransferase
VPLWFCGALLVFNIDRALPDEADAINLPQRRATNRRLRWVSWLLAIGSASMLVYLPIQQRDWSTLVLVLLGGTVCLSYSLPILGRRLKEIPLLKTFFAPSLVVLAILSLPLIHEKWPSQPGLVVLTAVWAWGYLLCNMLICDLRDIRGDRRTGVVSIPVHLGRKATHRLLWILITCTGGLAFLLAAFPGSSARVVLMLWAILGSAYLAGLVVAAQQRRSESFYEWWVEGMLFLPAVVVAIFR